MNLPHDKTNLDNRELVQIYDYLRGRITRITLADELGRTRTNTYYYIGRAVHYWLKMGIIKFHKIKDKSDLGGKDIL